MCEQPFDRYTEWMSLAQDGMLDSTQSHLLHGHLAICPSCQVQWEAMTAISHAFHTVPMVAPVPGFAVRFQARLVYQQEQRRQAAVWGLLGAGVIALILLSLPSLASTLFLTGRLVLPYQVFAYVQGLFQWIQIVLDALAGAAWLLVRHVATQPAALTYAATAAAVNILGLIWVRFMLGRLAAQRVS